MQRIAAEMSVRMHIILLLIVFTRIYNIFIRNHNVSINIYNISINIYNTYKCTQHRSRQNSHGKILGFLSKPKMPQTDRPEAWALGTASLESIPDS